MSMSVDQQSINPIAKVAAGISLAGIISFGVWTNTALPYNDEIPKNNMNPILPMKVQMKNKYCLEKNPDDRSQCMKVFGKDAFTPVRDNYFYAGPTGF